MAKFNASPCKSPPAWQVFRFAVTPLRRGEVQQFAVQKSAKPPGFSLRRGEVQRFAAEKSTGAVGFPLRRRAASP
jgi:hypothetical protein